MNKTIIIPIIAFLAVMAKLIFNIDVSEDVQQQVVDVSGSVVALGALLYGIVKNHKK